MLDELIIKKCSPTLAGIKTGNIFRVFFSDIRELKDSIRDLNRRLCPKGVRIIPLQTAPDSALLYLYRDKALAKDLSDERSASLLSECGYDSLAPNRCISCLINKLKTMLNSPMRSVFS